MTINYELGIIKENVQVRKSAGVFEVAHMGQRLSSCRCDNIKYIEKLSF